MRNELQLFSNPQFGQIRVVELEQQPYFVGRDVASALGYRNPVAAMTQHVDNEDSVKHAIPDNQGFTQDTTLITESGVYSLVFGSKLPQAKVFKRWVTSEVLPEIRRHGGYMATAANETPEQIMARALMIAQQTIERTKEKIRLQQEQIEVAAPKVQYYNEVLQSDNTYNINQIAKELGMSGVTLNDKLRRLGVQYRQGGTWLLTHKYQSKEYTKTRTHTFVHSDGRPGTAMQTVWTEKGRAFIHRLLGN